MTTTRKPIDPELNAMRRVLRILDELSPEEAANVSDWARARAHRRLYQDRMESTKQSELPLTGSASSIRSSALA